MSGTSSGTRNWLVANVSGLVSVPLDLSWIELLLPPAMTLLPSWARTSPSNSTRRRYREVEHRDRGNISGGSDSPVRKIPIMALEV